LNAEKKIGRPFSGQQHQAKFGLNPALLWSGERNGVPTSPQCAV